MNLSKAIELSKELDKFLTNTCMIDGSFIKDDTYKSEAISSRAPDLRKYNSIGTKSGVYFMVRPSGDIAYIGKATKNNLHAEIWNKLKTPTVGLNGELLYPTSCWANGEIDHVLKDEIYSGSIYIAAIVVEPTELASLLEVYLQTCCELDEEKKLPPLNARIG